LRTGSSHMTLSAPMKSQMTITPNSGDAANCSVRHEPCSLASTFPLTAHVSRRTPQSLICVREATRGVPRENIADATLGEVWIPQHNPNFAFADSARSRVSGRPYHFRASFAFHASAMTHEVSRSIGFRRARPVSAVAPS
jgi:hypothetical protein